MRKERRTRPPYFMGGVPRSTSYRKGEKRHPRGSRSALADRSFHRNNDTPSRDGLGMSRRNEFAVRSWGAATICLMFKSFSAEAHESPPVGLDSARAPFISDSSRMRHCALLGQAAPRGRGTHDLRRCAR